MLSPALSKLINRDGHPSNISYYDCNYPIKLSSKHFNKKMAKLEKEISPDCVFSVFGPTYWKPESPHVMGFANGLYLFDDLPFYSKMNIVSKLKEFLRKNYHKYLLKDNAEHYIVETDKVKERLSSFLDLSLSNISTVPNAYHPSFDAEIADLEILSSKKKNEFRFITVSSFYQHKNLDIINDLIPLLKSEGIDCKFILTIPQNIFESHFDKTSSYLINVGPIEIEQCPYLYNQSDTLFLPTLVECFSVSYLEAMKSKIPIITSDYDFSRGICGEAALYFDPLNPESIVYKIKKIMRDQSLRESLIKEGTKQLKKYPMSFSRTKSYIEICEKTSVKI